MLRGASIRGGDHEIPVDLEESERRAADLAGGAASGVEEDETARGGMIDLGPITLQVLTDVFGSVGTGGVDGPVLDVRPFDGHDPNLSPWTARTIGEVQRLSVALVVFIASCTSSTEGSTITTAGGDTTTTRSPAGWVELAPMEIARSEHPAVVLDDEIVVLGGLIEVGVGRTGVTASVEAYTPATDTWRILTELPEARHHGMAAVVGDRIFFIGGYTSAGDPSTAVWELDGDTWVGRAPTPIPVGAASAAAVGQEIYLVGGVPEGLFLRYEVARDRWYALAPPPTRREHVASVHVNGEVWAIAGRWMGEIFDTTDIFDLETETWREGPRLLDPRSGFGAVVVEDSVFVAGGEVFDPDEALKSVERLDDESRGWLSVESLPHGLHGNPLVAAGRHVYIPGGSTRAADVVNDGATYRLDVT